MAKADRIILPPYKQLALLVFELVSKHCIIDSGSCWNMLCPSWADESTSPLNITNLSYFLHIEQIPPNMQKPPFLCKLILYPIRYTQATRVHDY